MTTTNASTVGPWSAYLLGDIACVVPRCRKKPYWKIVFDASGGWSYYCAEHGWEWMAGQRRA